MKVTVVTRTYNRPDYLKEALLSLEFQTHKDWELLIFDDAANEENLKIYKKFKERHTDKRILYITSATPYEMYRDNWTIGADICKGEISIRLDDDDLLAEDCLEFISDLFERHSDLDFTYGSCAVFNEGGLVRIIQSQNPFEAPKSTSEWGGYTEPNNHPWKEPWTFIPNYYTEPQTHTSIIHCSKENIMCIVHPYIIRTSSLKKVRNKIKITSNFVDDLEILGSLDNLGLGHNSIKKVLCYMREHTTGRVTDIGKKIEETTLWDDIFRIRDEVDYLRPAGFLSRVVPLDSDYNFNDGIDSKLKFKFSSLTKKIKEFGF